MTGSVVTVIQLLIDNNQLTKLLPNHVSRYQKVSCGDGGDDGL